MSPLQWRLVKPRSPNRIEKKPAISVNGHAHLSHPALRATFSRWEKGIRKASLHDFHGVPYRLRLGDEAYRQVAEAFLVEFGDIALGT